MSKFLHNNDNDHAKAMAISWVFSENSQAKNGIGLTSHDPASNTENS